jgi:hypothetical protein
VITMTTKCCGDGVAALPAAVAMRPNGDLMAPVCSAFAALVHGTAVPFGAVNGAVAAQVQAAVQAIKVVDGTPGSRPWSPPV